FALLLFPFPHDNNLIEDPSNLDDNEASNRLFVSFYNSDLLVLSLLALVFQDKHSNLVCVYHILAHIPLHKWHEIQVECCSSFCLLMTISTNLQILFCNQDLLLKGR